MRHILHLAWNVKVHACKNLLGNDLLPNRYLTGGEEKKLRINNTANEEIENVWWKLCLNKLTKVHKTCYNIASPTYSETHSCFRDARKRVILNWSRSIRKYAWISHPCGTRLMHSIGGTQEQYPWIKETPNYRGHQFQNKVTSSYLQWDTRSLFTFTENVSKSPASILCASCERADCRALICLSLSIFFSPCHHLVQYAGLWSKCNKIFFNLAAWCGAPEISCMKCTSRTGLHILHWRSSVIAP